MKRFMFGLIVLLSLTLPALSSNAQVVVAIGPRHHHHHRYYRYHRYHRHHRYYRHYRR
jgi:hypothetical protein